jgi:hypothetical protein
LTSPQLGHLKLIAASVGSIVRPQQLQRGVLILDMFFRQFFARDVVDL